jgi:putative oxidoreductase
MKEDGRIIAFSAGLFLLRLILGLILFAHGALILFNWWSGQGMSDYSDYLAQGGLDFFIGANGWAWIVGLVQFVGGILLIFGLMTRLSALLNAIVVILLMCVVEGVSAFFIVLYGISQAGSVDFNGGIEYSMLLAGTCLALFLAGAGKYSIDAGFAPKKKKEEKPPDRPIEKKAD